MTNHKACLGLLLVGFATAYAAPASHETPIRFKHGAKRVVLVGEISRLTPSHTYVYAAKKGGHLKIDVTTPGGGNGLATMWHIVFPSGNAFGQKGYDPFNGKLTESGKYRIVVEVNQMATEADHGKYRLTLTR